MVLNYGANPEEMYADFSIVPDNAYKSPVHSPFCHTYDPVHSPASSEVSTVDSAFDELAGVIPELDVDLSCDDESPKCYKDLSNMSPYASSGYFEDENSNNDSDDSDRRTPSMYDGFYTYPVSPMFYQDCMEKPAEHVLLQAAMKSAAKRAAPPSWFNDYTDLSQAHDVGSSAKRLKQSTPAEMAKHAEILIASPEHETQHVYEGEFHGYHTPDINNNIEFSDPQPVYNEQQDAPEDKKPASFMLWDEDVLTKGFEILAEYISRDTQPIIKQEVTSDVQPQSHVAKHCQSRMMSDVARYKSAMQQASLARHIKSEDAEHASEEPPMMFSMSNTNLQQANAKKLPLKQEKKGSTCATEIVRNWKVPVRQRRSALCLQSTKPRLYNFLLELLQDPDLYPCIEWVDESQGIFKFLDSAQIASLWGHRKNKPNMKYENFARSLRTYIAKGILRKPRNKLVYQFTSKVLKV